MRPRLVVTLGPTTLRGERLGGSGPWSGAVEHRGPETVADALAELTRRAEVAGGTRLEVVVEEGALQTRRLPDLPPMRAKDLQALVALQPSRFFRRNGTPLVTDARWISARPPVALAVAIEESWVEAITLGAEAVGLRLRAIGAAAHPESDLNLLPDRWKASRLAATKRLAWRLGIAAGIVWALAVSAYLTRLELAHRATMRALAEIEAPVAALTKARLAYRRAAEMVATVGEHRADGGKVLGALATVAGALPDSAYLTTFVLREDGTGLLTGSAPSALEVVAALDQARVPGVRLDGVPMRDSPGRERFSAVFGARAPTGSGGAP